MRYAVFRLLAIAALLLVQPTLPAAAQTVLYDKSRITCVSRQMNVPVEARFRTFTAQIAFDPARPEAGSARLEINTDSFDIENAEINDEIKGKLWFDTRTHPKAVFVSSSIKPLGGGRYEVRGPMTIKGRTLEVVAPFSYKAEGGTGVYDGAFTIKRLQFNIGEGVWKDTDTVADDVHIRFRIVVAGGKPAAKK